MENRTTGILISMGFGKLSQDLLSELEQKFDVVFQRQMNIESGLHPEKVFLRDIDAFTASLEQFQFGLLLLNAQGGSGSFLPSVVSALMAQRLPESMIVDVQSDWSSSKGKHVYSVETSFKLSGD